jgi:alpha-ketoglutarate-dependent taurine dioxygenase
MSDPKGVPGGFAPRARQAIRLDPQALVDKQPLFPDRAALLVRPRRPEVNLIGWAIAHRADIDADLDRHGAILFRGFAVESLARFEEFAAATSDRVMEYEERSSPRTTVQGHVYTSTDHPPDQDIFLHNEHSYSRVYPRKILFHCVQPATVGGRTPIADCRRVLDRIPPEIREAFTQRRYMYVRNFGDGFGLSWPTAFQTTDPRVVERYCRGHDIDVEWRPGGRLRTRQVRDAIVRHARTSEEVWFNHATFFHVSTLAPEVQAVLRREVGDDPPNNTCYGDGAPIEPGVLEVLRAAYVAEQRSFAWEAGDILMLDNVLMAHGRTRYRGERRVVVAMTDPVDTR